MNWILSKKDEKVEDIYENITTNYMNILDKFENVRSYANIIDGKIKEKVNRCKVLSERVKFYDISEIKTKIIENF
ncbi:MAG: hypothetical protein MJ252_29765 [archaeon]|nr:hypothetical protein [archaeon]MCQ2978160.1 hypothetical protein [archaeon]